MNPLFGLHKNGRAANFIKEWIMPFDRLCRKYKTDHLGDHLVIKLDRNINKSNAKE